MAVDEQQQQKQQQSKGRAPTTRRAAAGSINRRNRRHQCPTTDDRDDEDDPTSVSTGGSGSGGGDREEQAEQENDHQPHQEQPPPHEQNEYYDHNRNLTTHLNKNEQQKPAKDQTQPEVTTKTTILGSDQETIRCRENVSPVGSSLSTQSGDCAQAHFHCDASPYGTCLNSSGASSSDHSTGRMSQTSLVAAPAATAPTTMTNEGSQQRQQQAERAVKFQVGELIDLQQMAEKQQQQQQHTAITIREACDENDDAEFGPQFRSGELTKTGGGRSASLVRQLGRRVSLFPQALARQMTWRDGSHERVAHRVAADDSRRFSLPVSRGDASSSPSSPSPELDELSPLRSAIPAQPDPVPTTVAGVGGTITTVTRSKRKTAPLPRLVAKNGQVNLFLDNIDRRQYMRDLFTTMIDIKWRYNLMAAAFGFVFSWLFFACIWYLVLYFHNDLEHENDPNWSPCIVNVYSFPAALLFSIETQSTLGFGSRIISVECPGAILIFCSQLIFGVVVECLIVGMVFAKLSRPTKRSQTIMYSKYATVCLREGKMCLTFRVGDVRSKSHIIGATLRASLVSSKVTQEGELIPFYHHKLRVIIDDCKNSLLLIWPVTIVHVIDESSPFYKLNADELINFKFEIITVLEGTVESTGQSIQVRSSYLPSEVKWGYRFEPIVSTHGIGKYAQTIIDYNKFNRILEVPTPKCSPLDYYTDQAKLCSVRGGGGDGGGGDGDAEDNYDAHQQAVLACLTSAVLT